KGSPRGSTMRVNLIMAMCWIILGVPLVILGLIESDGGNIRVGDSQIAVQFMGWMALVLAAYNLLRWYASRAVRDPRKSTRKEMRRRMQASAEATAEKKVTNPEFTFDDKKTP